MNFDKNHGLAEENTSTPTAPAWALERLRCRRNLILLAVLAGFLLALLGAVLVPNEYSSSATLMPPEQQAFSPMSALDGLNGQIPVMAAGGLLNSKSAGAVPIAILESRTVQDDIINQFDLRRVYKKKLYETTRIKLATNTEIKEDRKSGVISIAVTDRDPSRAREIVMAYISDLNAVSNRVSTSSAGRERQFLESRISSVKRSLDEDTRALSEFSSKNVTLDYQKQGQATLEMAAKLQAELITAQSELSALKTVFTDDNVQVQTARAQIAEFQTQLRKIIGQDQSSAQMPTGNFPSIRQLPLLSVTYADLMRKVTIEGTIYAALEKQYELARIQEAKEIPIVKVLDSPDMPERKSFPPRAVLSFLGALLGALGGCAWVLISSWRTASFRFTTAEDPEQELAYRRGYSQQ